MKDYIVHFENLKGLHFRHVVQANCRAQAINKTYTENPNMYRAICVQEKTKKIDAAPFLFGKARLE